MSTSHNLCSPATYDDKNDADQSDGHQRTNHLWRIVHDDDGDDEDDDGYEEEDQNEDEDAEV